MAVNLGQNPIQDIKLGTMQVEKVYLRDELIFSGGDDGNFLSQPAKTYTDAGVTWTWDKMNASGNGEKATSANVYMTDTLRLKTALINGASYTFSTAEVLPRRRAIYLTLSDEEGHTVTHYIATESASRTFTTNNNYTKYRLYLNTRSGEVIDNTFKDIKLVKES